MVKSHLIWQLNLTRVKSFHQCRLQMVTDIKDDMAVHAIDGVNSNPFKRKTLQIKVKDGTHPSKV